MRHFAFSVALLLLFCVEPFVFAENDIAIGVNPASVQPVNGKLPASVYLAVFEKDCAQQDKDLSAYSIQITGGLSVSSQTAGKCVIAANISLDSNTPAGNYTVVLLDGGKKPTGHAKFAILDTNAGPIPPGVAPQVDVIWGVLSQDVCAPIFGRRVSGRFYCVEVKLGNNTGHPLQLAGIGFKLSLAGLPHNNGVPGILPDKFLQPNTSYASARAVLLQGSILDRRNLAYHSLQAAGILMGAFTPYFARPTAKSHWATGASIASGAALDAFNIILPDPVITHLNNLDDESFRDNQVIPNNAQVRTMVFVEKDALTLELQGITCKLYPNAKTCPASSGSDSKGLQLAGKLATETVNNSQEPLFGSKKFSPFLVKLALGDLVVVGDEIEYLQRVQVQTSSAAVAAITVSPTKLSFGNQAINTASAVQTITITNSGSAAVSGLKTEVSGANRNDFCKQDDSCKPASTTCTDTLAAAASCTVSIAFKPTTGATGVRAATLNVSFTGIGSPQTVSLEGQATAPAPPAATSPASTPTVSLDKTTLTFGSQTVNTTSAPQTVTLTNSGSTGLDSVSASVTGAGSGDFAKVDCARSVAASGGTCAISVTFTPKGRGASSAALSVTYTGAQQPLTVTLSGTGN